MATTYSLHITPANLVCDECGEPDVDMVLVADTLEDGTGYQDVKPLCLDCFDIRQGVGVQAPAEEPRG